MKNFEYIELERPSETMDVSIPCIKLNINAKTLPEFDNINHHVAWLKYIFDSNKIEKFSRLCGKCRNVLMDRENICPVCKSKVDTIFYANSIDICITNTRQISNIQLRYKDIGKNIFSFIDRLYRYFPSEYKNLFIHKNCYILTFPSLSEFPTDEEYKKEMMKTIFLAENTNKLYILDSEEIYTNIYSLYSQSYLVSLHIPEHIGYIEVTENNMPFVLERAKKIEDR